MSENLNDRFKVSYENEASASYVVIELDENEVIIQFQVDMIANNPHPSIIPLTVRNKNNKSRLYYNVTSKVPLKQVFKRSLKKNDLINIFTGISKVILESKNYFLDESKFLLLEDMIFLNPVNFEVSLAYLPLQCGLDAVQNFKDFIIRIVVYSADIKYTNDDFLQRILSYVKTENFNISEFNKLLYSLKDNSVNFTPKSFDGIQDIQNQNPIHTDNKAPVKDSPITNTNNNEKEVPGLKTNNNLSRNNQKNIPPVNIPGQKGIPVNIPVPGDKTGNRKKQPKAGINAGLTGSSNGFFIKGLDSKLLIRGIAIQSAIIIIAIGIFLNINVKALGDTTTTTYAAAFIIVAAVSFLIWRKLLSMKTQTVSNEPQVTVNRPVKQIPQKENELDMDRFKFKNKQSANETPKNTNSNNLPDLNEGNSYNTGFINDSQNNKTVIIPQGLGETVIMDNSPRMVPVSAENARVILIDKSSVIIGRLEGKADHVMYENTVGKIHAEVIKRDGKCFIKDLNSRNGTFLNNEKLGSNIEYPLKNNDKVKFANVEYTFLDKQ